MSKKLNFTFKAFYNVKSAVLVNTAYQDEIFAIFVSDYTVQRYFKFKYIKKAK